MVYSRLSLVYSSRLKPSYSFIGLRSFTTSLVPSRSSLPAKKPASKTAKSKLARVKAPLAWGNILVGSKSVAASESKVDVSLSPSTAPIIKSILKDYEEVHSRNLASEQKLLRFVDSQAKTLDKDSQDSQTHYAEDGAFEELLNETKLNQYTNVVSEVASLAMSSTEGKLSQNLVARRTHVKVLPGDLFVKQDLLGIVLKEDFDLYTCLFSNGNIVVSSQDSFTFHEPNFLASSFVTDVVNKTKVKDLVVEFQTGGELAKFLPLAINLLVSIENKAASFVMVNHRELTRFLKEFDGGDFQSHNITELFKQFRATSTSTSTSTSNSTLPYERLGFYNFATKQFELFFPDRDHLNHLVSYPKNIVTLSKELNALVRTNHESLDSFIHKAVKLIKLKQNKFNTDFLQNIFPEESPAFIPKLAKVASKFQSLVSGDSELTFNEADLKYIRGIWQFILSEKMALSSSFTPLACAIIKPLGYSYVNAPNALQFLKDIGAAKLCENLNLHHYSIQFNHHPESLNIPTVLEGFQDSYAAIRHDFGDLPVFTIDDPDAKEIDDGISIEQVGQDNHCWLHVHIADPTTLIEFNSELDFYCRKQPLTVYTPEMCWPMLPNSVSHGFCSLDSSIPGPRFVLTFSALLDSTGNLVDYQIRPGKVNNIIPISYDQANHLLGIDEVVPLKGSVPSTKSVDSTSVNPIDASHVVSLKKLHALVHGHFLIRKSNGAIDLLSHSVMIKSGSGSGSGPSSVSSFKSSIEGNPQPDYTGFDKPPSISYKLVRNHPRSSQNMVAESMVIAGRLAALYCSQHNLPLPFIAQASPDPGNLNTVNKMLNPSIDQQTDLINFLVIRHYFKPAGNYLTPSPHFSMGLKEGYLRVTSPLRRYTDMLAHWQIKNHLLHPKNPPLFSDHKIVSLMEEISHPFQDIRNLSLRSDRFWMLSLLQRFEYETAKCPVYFQSQNKKIIKRIYYPKTLPEEKIRSQQAKPVYRGRLVRYEPTISSWIAMILPFEKSVIFRGNKALCQHSGVSPEELHAKFKPGQEVEMIVYSLIPDYNKVLFVDPID